MYFKIVWFKMSTHLIIKTVKLIVLRVLDLMRNNPIKYNNYNKKYNFKDKLMMI